MTQQPRLYPELCRRFIEESGRVRTEKSAKSFRSVLRTLQTAYPARGVGQFTTQHLTEFCLSNKPAPATVSNRRSIISSFFGWCKFQGIVKADPSTDLKWTVTPGKYGVREHTWLSGTQLKDLLKSLPSGSLPDRRDRALVATGLLTGLRLEGLVGLRWSSFSDDMRDIRLKVKGGKIYEASIPDDLLPILKDWRRELGSCQGRGADSPVFPSFRFGINDLGENDMVLHPDVALGEQGARQVVAKAGKLIGVKLRPHDMRRSYANLLEESGFVLDDIRAALGHENVSTTTTYLEKSPAKAKSVGRRLKL